MSFDTLGLLAELVRAVDEQGYTTPTPIQSQAIPIILKGGDLLGGAQTGTGKTAGFTLPILQLLSRGLKGEGKKRPLRALILTPTRELAAQVEGSIRLYGKYLPLKSTAIFGGVKMNPQIAALRQGVDVLVATPGRLLDHANQQTIDFSQVEILVLDEADHMLDMGFIHDVRKIINLLPKKRQNLLFSATFSANIKKLADQLLDTPARIEVDRCNSSSEQVKHVIHPVDRRRKSELLSHLITSHSWPQVLVFTRTKHGADHLAVKLEKNGISAATIHGNKSQVARMKALARFKKGKVRALVATDIAARGLDIDQLPHVVNFDLPNVPEDYIHRVGRTGRGGCKGEAVSLVCSDEYKLLRDIERLMECDLSKVTVPGYEGAPLIVSESIQRSRKPRVEMNNSTGRPKHRFTKDPKGFGRRSSKPSRSPRGRKNGAGKSQYRRPKK